MNKFRPVSVLIAEDHPISREGLLSIINHEPGLEVAVEAGNWPEAIRALCVHRPELALIGLRMTGTEVASAITAAHAESPATRIVVTAYEGDEHAYQSLRAGAKGYLPKDAGREALLECIRAVLDGKTWIHPNAASQLAARTQAPDITSREIEVLEFVAAGKSNEEISESLGITQVTVKVHVNHLFAKLHVNGRVAATLLALQRGFVHFPAGPVSACSLSVSQKQKLAS